jgi:hypothetical protein
MTYGDKFAALFGFGSSNRDSTPMTPRNHSKTLLEDRSDDFARRM